MSQNRLIRSVGAIGKQFERFAIMPAGIVRGYKKGEAG